MEMNKRPSAADQVVMEIEANKPSGNGMVVGGLSPLSESLWKEKTHTEFVGDVSARLAWKDLTVVVTLGNGDTQNVLDKLSGYAEPGSFTALMGPSGSGKFTLLDALSSRLAANAFLSGTILLNGRKANLSFGTAAYVTQDDNLIGTLTVRETISYSARLRLPDKMPWSDKRALIESTIIEMGLQDCADTVIGNWHLRGISGGEKRRVSIALEILMRPRLLFLDEPTSGLDRVGDDVAEREDGGRGCRISRPPDPNDNWQNFSGRQMPTIVGKGSSGRSTPTIAQLEDFVYAELRRTHANFSLKIMLISTHCI